MSDIDRPDEGFDPTPRLSGEGQKPYAVFLAYRDMGRFRTLDQVRRLAGPNSGPVRCLRLVERWSSDYRWVERCRAFDDRMEVIRQRSREQAAADEARLWEIRRHQAIHSAWEDAQALRVKAREMLKHPVNVEVDDGGKITLKPGRWTFNSAAAILKCASELECAAIAAVTRPIEDYSDAELAAIEGAQRGEIPADHD